MSAEIGSCRWGGRGGQPRVQVEHQPTRITATSETARVTEGSTKFSGVWADECCIWLAPSFLSAPGFAHQIWVSLVALTD
jgi:hypothetical protein